MDNVKITRSFLLNTNEWIPEECSIFEFWDMYKKDVIEKIGDQPSWVGVCIPHSDGSFDYHAGYMVITDGDMWIPETEYTVYRYGGDYSGIAEWQLQFSHKMEAPHLEVYLDDGSMMYYIPVDGT